MKLKLFLTSLIFTTVFCLVSDQSFSQDYKHQDYDFLIASTDGKKITLSHEGKVLKWHKSKILDVCWLENKPYIASRSNDEIIVWLYSTNQSTRPISFFIKHPKLGIINLDYNNYVNYKKYDQLCCYEKHKEKDLLDIYEKIIR